MEHFKRYIGRNTNQIILQIMALSGIAWFILFCYAPMYGLTLAFKEYSFKKGILGSPFAGLVYFKELFEDPEIAGVVTNTVAIGVLKLLICFPMPILFAMLLNELSSDRLKKLVQTASYFPHFISWIIISLIITYWFSPEFGIVNKVLLELRIVEQPITPLTDPGSFYGLAVISEMWKEMGWSAIIYIAAIAGIDTTLYEAATVDGATKVQRIIHITLPGISGAIILMFLMSFASLFSGGSGTFEQSYFLGNPMNYDKSMVLSYYTMKTGIMLGRFSYATAVGLLNSVVSLVLLLISNGTCKKLFNRSLYFEGEY